MSRPPTIAIDPARTPASRRPAFGAARDHARAAQKMKTTPSRITATGRDGTTTGRVNAIKISSAPSNRMMNSVSKPKRFAVEGIAAFPGGLSIRKRGRRKLPARATRPRAGVFEVECYNSVLFGAETSLTGRHPIASD
jgi:hypothetical protein